MKRVSPPHTTISLLSLFPPVPYSFRCGLRLHFAYGFCYARAGCHQIVKAIDRLAGCPGDAAQQQYTEQRVVECPGEVTRDRDENTAAILFGSPEQRLRLVFFDAGGKKPDALRVPKQVPVTFVVKVNAIEIAGDGMLAVGELHVERAVAKL